eukprot:SAG11_NODE_19560_length_464_cov_0.684932_1_plen_77_part_01
MNEWMNLGQSHVGLGMVWLSELHECFGTSIKSRLSSRIYCTDRPESEGFLRLRRKVIGDRDRSARLRKLRVGLNCPA